MLIYFKCCFYINSPPIMYMCVRVLTFYFSSVYSVFILVATLRWVLMYRIEGFVTQLARQN